MLEREIPHLPRDGKGPVFPTPWAARAFAMTLQLHQAGHFTWPEWVSVFSDQLSTSTHGPHALAGDAEDYYECWVEALEKILATKEVFDRRALHASRVSTIANWPEPDHSARREPVARSLPLV
ncbi:MAG TPA: nitrile hydratase accessory protein [Anaerolineae bacterium]